MKSHNYLKQIIFTLTIFLIINNSFAEWFMMGDTSCVIDYGRITSDHQYNHPFNPFQAADGTIMMFGVSGVAEGDNTHVAVYRLEGTEWVHYEITGADEWFDPTTALAENGDIYCFYIRDLHTQYYKVSKDHGKTWGDQVTVGVQAEYLGEQNNPKQDIDGTWMGVHGTGNPNGDRYFARTSSADLSNLSGWSQIQIDDKWGTGDVLIRNYTQTLNGRYKHLSLILRCDFGCDGNLSFATSDDAGENWSVSVPGFTTDLQCPDDWDAPVWGGATRTGVTLDIGDNYGPSGPLAGKSIIATAVGFNYCDYMGVPGPGGQFKRAALAIMTSETGEADGWDLKLLFREDASVTNENCDPGMIQAQDRSVWVCFTGRGGSAVRYVHLNPDILFGNNPTDIQPQIMPSYKENILNFSNRENSGIRINRSTALGHISNPVLLDLQGRVIPTRVERLSGNSLHILPTKRISNGIIIVKTQINDLKTQINLPIY